MTADEAIVITLAKAIAKAYGWDRWGDLSHHSRKLLMLAAAHAYGVLKHGTIE